MLSTLLEIKPGITAVIGSGGKTTLLSALAAELSARGTVILTTSTRIYPFPGMINLTDPTEKAVLQALHRERVLCAGTPAPEGKLSAPALPFSALSSLADYVIVEADGAKGRPLKAHRPGEPVIPAGSTQVVLVAGMSAMGQPIRDAAHRPELYAALAGCEICDAVTPALAAKVILAEGLHDRVFLNQAESGPAHDAARSLARRLGCPAAAGSLQKGVFTCLC